MDPTTSAAQAGAYFLFDSSIRKFIFILFALGILAFLLCVGACIMERAIGFSVRDVVDKAEKSFDQFVDNNGKDGAWQPAIYILCSLIICAAVLIASLLPK